MTERDLKSTTVAAANASAKLTVDQWTIADDTFTGEAPAAIQARITSAEVGEQGVEDMLLLHCDASAGVARSGP